MRVRSATAEDEAFLWEMLTHAASMPDAGSAAAIASAQSDPNLFGYVRGWGREADLGVVAESPDGEALGAAWVRAGRPGHAGGTPEPADEAELAIATLVAARGRELVVVEVKTRRSGSLTPPEAAATQRKFRALSRAAACYLRTVGWEGEVQFDLAAAEAFPDGTIRVELIENALEYNW